MKNIAVFCKNREQMDNYLLNAHGNTNRMSPAVTSCHEHDYFYMNAFNSVDYIKGIRWDAIIHLPEYKQQPELIEQVMLNLKEAPKKSKWETLIEELESKLAEVQLRINDLKQEK